jgi:hypothetical protein
MEYSQVLDCLAVDFARLRAVAPSDPAAAVPTCPGWTVADLTRHVGEVYLHKTLAMREGAEPEPWPPRELADEEPLKVFVAYGVAEWGDDFADILADSPGRTYTVRTDGAAWRAQTGPGLFAVADGTDNAADVTVSGPPTAVLRCV